MTENVIVNEVGAAFLLFVSSAKGFCQVFRGEIWVALVYRVSRGPGTSSNEGWGNGGGRWVGMGGCRLGVVVGGGQAKGEVR